jgi:hypothetical protein
MTIEIETIWNDPRWLELTPMVEPVTAGMYTCSCLLCHTPVDPRYPAGVVRVLDGEGAWPFWDDVPDEFTDLMGDPVEEFVCPLCIEKIPEDYCSVLRKPCPTRATD